MNTTIAQITYRGMLGSRRVFLLLGLPVLLLALTGVLYALASSPERVTILLMERFGVAMMLPLLGLIVGTGVIGREIEDGVIMHLLAKPIRREVVSVTKLIVAASLMALFGALPIFISAFAMMGWEADVALGFAVGALAGGVAYAAVFLLISIVTRFAVTVGIIYALIWEGVVGTVAPGARDLSIQQWTLSIADAVSSSAFLKSQVAPGFAIPALIVTTLLATILAGRRLRSLTLSGSE
ncbi:ABC transporter permease subunit [Rhizohabitans arisaemae]|uniref:ABC transporter permease subunit n=1 Tax=Rhizohabitans arisaemae TaxID=2720610 RepID=UPI0024B20BD1|nr:ABC transporter permease subunit [Rhizohabitans arisaemae]